MTALLENIINHSCKCCIYKNILINFLNHYLLMYLPFLYIDNPFWKFFNLCRGHCILTEIRLVLGMGREKPSSSQSDKYGHKEQPRNHKRWLLGANLTFNYFLCIRGIWQVEVCEGAQARSEGMLLMLKSDHVFPGNYSRSQNSTSHSHWNMIHHTTQPWNEIGSDQSKKNRKKQKRKEKKL